MGCGYGMRLWDEVQLAHAVGRYLQLRDPLRRKTMIREDRAPSRAQPALHFIERAVLRHGRSPISRLAALGGGDDIDTDIAHDPDYRPLPHALEEIPL
jgi:hypothetical protein